MLVPTRSEIAYGLTGTWQLIRGKQGAILWFDNSVPGVRKSFYAAVLIAPLYAILLWTTGYERFPNAELLSIYAIEAVAYVGAWLIWPVIAFEVNRLFALELDVKRYVVAMNWAQIWIMLAALPLALLSSAGVLGPQLVGLADMIMLMAILAFSFIIARETLPLGAMAAAGVAMAELIVGLMWRAGTSAAVQPWLGGPLITS